MPLPFSRRRVLSRIPAAVLAIALLSFLSLPAVAARAEPFAGSQPAQVLYASPEGHGQACSQDHPCGLVGVQGVVRKLDQNMQSDIVVQLADGTYRLDTPLDFTAADSGTNGHQVIWEAGPGAHPIISGGRQVTNWHQVNAAQNLWAAGVPPSFQTRQVYVDGARAPVAQGAPPVALAQVAGGFTAADATYSHWRNPSGIEFVFTGGTGSWTESRCRVASISGTVITMQQPCWDNITDRPQSRLSYPTGDFPNLPSDATPNRIENAYELLHPGQWYLDTSQHLLYYMAPAGSDPNQADVEAAQLQTLVSGDGTLDAPVHDIVLRGLQFSYATWLAPSGPDGFSEIQANIRITGDQRAVPQGTCTFTTPPGTCPFGANAQDPGNVTFRAAHNITIEDNTFSHLGAAGLTFGYGSQHNLILGNTFTDISGIGISLGDTNAPHPSDVGADNREINLGNTIEDNYIHHIGAEFAGADGILLLYTQQTTVTHNEITDVPWDGIDSGANGGHLDTSDHPDVTTSINADNTISDNLIYDYHSVLSDGGAIYLEGHQGSTIYNADGSVNEDASFEHGMQVTGNVVYNDLHSGLTLYDDIGSQWITWTGNVEFNNSYGNGGCAPVGHIRFTGNYYADQIGFFPCSPAPVDLQYSSNTPLPLRPTPSDMPTQILANAGLQPAYWHLATNGPPRVVTVSPRSGAVSTATPVLITGSGFTAGAAVSFAGQPASSVQVLSPTFIEATAPAGAITAEATVTTAAGSYSGPSGLPLADVTADSMDDEAYWHVSFTPYNAFDDNLNTFWSSAATPMPHWIQVQFTHPLTLGKVVVQTRRFPGQVIQDVTATASLNGSPPQTVGTVTGNTAEDIAFSFAQPVTADTIRIQVNSETYYNSPRLNADIAEIRFYDQNGHMLGNP